MESSNKLNLFTFAKFQALLMTLVGLFAGILYSFGGLILDTLVTVGWITSNETPGLSHGTILAFGALIGMPIIFGIVGFLGGILEAILYNYFSNWFGKFPIQQIILHKKE